MELTAGAVLAQRYRIVRPLGRGGMGEVFAAENIRTGRIVAVKVLRADAKQKASSVLRFQREARAAGAINSDYVTQVLDVEEDAEYGIVIVFELLEGESLIDRLKRTGPMSFDDIFPLVEQIWMGLTDAHKAGIIHRDLKPSNVFLERRPDGGFRTKLLDFGISKIPREVGGETLTEMGQSLGTFSFMPPEQIGKAKTVDHRADIYAAATLIFQAMSGQLPYAAKNILQMVDLKAKSEPRPLSAVLGPASPPALDAFLARGLSRDPEVRFQTSAEALEAWRRLRDQPSELPGDGDTKVQAGPPQGMTSTPVAPARAPTPSERAFAASKSRPPATANPIRVPVVHDSTSEGPADQVATLAMPVRSVQQVLAQIAEGNRPGRAMIEPVQAMSTEPPRSPRLDPRLKDTAREGLRAAPTFKEPQGLPRLHDNDAESGNGTWLMPGQKGQSPGPSASFSNPSSTSASPGPASSGASASGRYPAFSSPPSSTAPNLSTPPPSSPASAESDLTTVYRRDTGARQGPQSAVPADLGRPETPRNTVGLIIGIVTFAAVGFLLVALILRRLGTGSFLP